MHIELNPKLLDVVESPAEESELGTVGTLTGTVLEVFGQPPEAVLIEVTDEEGAHKGFVTRLIDQVRTVWRPLRREESEVLASQAPQLFEKGVLLLQNGLIASAKDHFGQAFKEEPQLVGTLLNSANQLAEKGGFDAAIMIYQLVHELQPSYAHARENLARTYLNRGVQYARHGVIDRALEDFNATLLTDPSEEIIKLSQQNLAAAYSQLGIRHSEIKRYGEALENFILAFEIHPSALTRKNLALALVSFTAARREGRKQVLGKAGFHRAIQMGASLSECLNAYGATLANLGEMVDARKALQAAIDADPRNELARRNLEILQTDKFPPEITAFTLGLNQVEPQTSSVAR